MDTTGKEKNGRSPHNGTHDRGSHMARTAPALPSSLNLGYIVVVEHLSTIEHMSPSVVSLTRAASGPSTPPPPLRPLVQPYGSEFLLSLGVSKESCKTAKYGVTAFYGLLRIPNQ
ncbi:hypothetical protein PCH_Pc17g00680 [Penicillium rubens Wisconsin 54-1255]|uniref:Uncharacterized protein n=1 Tax=Penicillium rubens (strain ATCC 28089 / DSM 1075 / NRRL 1951 / Wisconsin 54-1255) TaxID=500485 RepID=B6HAZ1_PENRW|nr:hypothetical protein PCH_Pc17g00680 [Penicillium rubens Wisconsin 54-1255]